MRRPQAIPLLAAPARPTRLRRQPRPGWFLRSGAALVGGLGLALAGLALLESVVPK